MSSNEINGAGLPKNTVNAGKNHNSVNKEKLEKATTNAEIQKYFKEAKETNKKEETKLLKETEKKINKPLSKKEQAKAELRQLEVEYKKNYNTMTSEKFIELELKMDFIKNGLALGKYDE